MADDFCKEKAHTYQKEVHKLVINRIESVKLSYIVSTQFRAYPFERALFSALNRVLLIN